MTTTSKHFCLALFAPHSMLPPIVFNAITSPCAAGIATAPDDHSDWVTGIQALAPVEDALALISAILCQSLFKPQRPLPWAAVAL